MQRMEKSDKFIVRGKDKKRQIKEDEEKDE